MVESKSFGSRLFDVLNYALLFVLTVVFLYPLWYVLVGSISDPVRLFMHNGLLWRPLGFSLQGYRTMLQNPNVGIGYANTVYYVVVGTVNVRFPASEALSRTTARSAVMPGAASATVSLGMERSASCSLLTMSPTFVAEPVVRSTV